MTDRRTTCACASAISGPSATGNGGLSIRTRAVREDFVNNYKLHCFGQSGNSYKVALMLQALNQPWTPVHVTFAEFAGGLTRTDAWRQDNNVMGEVPILDTGTERLTQSGAILLWLA